jgi:hypothetical protein
VLFNLGLIALEATTQINVKCLYHYQQRVFSEVKKRELMAKIQGKYSKEFEDVLGGLLEYFPKDRWEYK